MMRQFNQGIKMENSKLKNAKKGIVPVLSAILASFLCEFLKLEGKERAELTIGIVGGSSIIWDFVKRTFIQKYFGAK